MIPACGLGNAAAECLHGEYRVQLRADTVDAECRTLSVVF